MSEPQSGTPPDHSVIALSIDKSLLPEWFEAIKRVAGKHARRMAVHEAETEVIARVELPDSSVDIFREELTTAWDAFVQARRQAGRWEETGA